MASASPAMGQPVTPGPSEQKSDYSLVWTTKEEAERVFPRLTDAWFSKRNEGVVVNPELLKLKVELVEELQRKLHPCQICGRTYALPRNRDNHMIMHGPNKLECEVCGKPYQLGRYFQQHRISKHGLPPLNLPGLPEPAESDRMPQNLKMTNRRPSAKETRLYRFWNFKI